MAYDPMNIETTRLGIGIVERWRGGPGDPDDPKGPGRSPTRPGGPDEQVDVKTRPVTQVPRRFKVIFHNDDYTTMEFVVSVLMQFFHKNETEATYLMLKVHKTGSAVAGYYPRDVAETKVQEVHKHAREHGMPLMLTAEPE
jgi:ATP-dependent Clp protease adaptor protein ClpS